MADDLREKWFRDGYIVCRKLFSAAQAQSMLEVCEEVLRQWREEDPQTGAQGGREDAHVMRHLNHRAYFTTDRRGLHQLLDAVADAGVLSVCASILEETPLFRCTSLFMNPQLTSEDGSWHRDSQFLTPDIEAEKTSVSASQDYGEAIQLQVALVPSADVEFVPGSHRRWDSPEEFEIRRADDGNNNRSNSMPGALRIELQPGDAVAFNPFGLHRGRYHAGKLRRTLMLTYTRSSLPCYDYFSHQPWFSEEGYFDEVAPATRAFFVPFVATYENEWEVMGKTFFAERGVT